MSEKKQVKPENRRLQKESESKQSSIHFHWCREEIRYVPRSRITLEYLKAALYAAGYYLLSVDHNRVLEGSNERYRYILLLQLEDNQWCAVGWGQSIREATLKAYDEITGSCGQIVDLQIPAEGTEELIEKLLDRIDPSKYEEEEF